MSKRGIEKRIQRAKELKRELEERGIDNPALMDTLILQVLMEANGKLSWLLGVAGVGIGLLLAVATKVF